jgi:hypothetical protein
MKMRIEIIAWIHANLQGHGLLLNNLCAEASGELPCLPKQTEDREKARHMFQQIELGQQSTEGISND